MPDVLILVGSESDKPRIEPAFDVLSKAGVSYEFHVSSAHRQPEQTAKLVPGARGQGFKAVHAGLGDIGTMFPDSEPRWQGADSLELLKQAYRAVLAAGHELVQADVTVIAEQPKIGPHVTQMRQRLAGALSVAPGAISVKGKTNEGMGWIGRAEGIAVIAVAVLE